MASVFVKEKQHRGGVLGKEREPGVVRGCNRASQRMLVDVTHIEVLEEAPPPTLSHRHEIPLLRIGPAPSRPAPQYNTSRSGLVLESSA